MLENVETFFVQYEILMKAHIGVAAGFLSIFITASYWASHLFSLSTDKTNWASQLAKTLFAKSEY